MATKAKRFVPDGYHTLTPYLIVRGGAAAIDFYVRAFGAIELYRVPMAGGKIGHAELRIGDSPFMLGEEMTEMKIVGPASLGGSPVGMCLYVADCDALFEQAVKAGAKVERPLADQFYGDRSGTVRDPFGHQWTIATHVEDLSAEEIQARAAKQMPPG